jgi:hypothetical protein
MKTRCIDIWSCPKDGAFSAHAAMLSLTQWFIMRIPYSFDFLIDHHVELARREVYEILDDLQHMRNGVKCGGMVTLMACLAKRAGFDAIELNFGTNTNGASHAVVLVDIGNGERVIYDPTLGYFSGKADGTPASIQTIIDFIGHDLGAELQWIAVEPREKRIVFGHDTRLPVHLSSTITDIDRYRRCATIDLDLFAAYSLGLVCRCADTQLAGVRSPFDYLRFPIGTSGEAEAEAIADQLCALKSYKDASFMKDEITPKTEAIAAHEAKIARLNQRIAEITASGQVAMAHRTALTQQLAAREAEIARLSQRIAEMTASGQVAMAHQTALTQQLAAREAEIARLSQRIAEMTACGQVVMQQLAAREAEIIAVYRSTSWRMTAPIRGAKRTARWLVTGTWSWITLKRGSRPRRVAQTFLKRVSRWLNDHPRLHARVLRMRRLVPPLERRRVTLAQLHSHGSANLPSTIAPAWGIDPDPDVLKAWRKIIDGNK